jgi:hypothetical protein
MLGVIYALCVSIFMLSVIMLGVIMLSIIKLCPYAEIRLCLLCFYCYAGCHYVECQYAAIRLC